MKVQRIAILSSYNLDLVGRPMKKALERLGVPAEIYLGAYGQWQQELIDPDSALYKFGPTATIIALDAEDLLPSLSTNPLTEIATARQRGLDAWERVRSTMQRLLERTAGQVIVHTLAAPPRSGLGLVEGNSGYSHTAAIDTFNQSLREASSSRLTVFNYDALVREHGYKHWYDTRLWHLARMRLANSSVKLLADAYAQLFAAQLTPRKKCLVLDLDNTLWGGVIGEDGVGGIQLGHSGIGLAFREFQLAVLALARRGVILAIASKNNTNDAMDALQNHPDMVLRPEHFAVMQIHWSEKSESVRRIAELLNIGVDSLVFWDDNPMERGVVRNLVPDVLVPEVPADASEYVTFLRALDCFDTTLLTAEDQARGRMYREQVERDSFLDNASPQSLDEYYASLQMKIHIERATDTAVARIAQLTQRTNQFNLTTRRYTDADVRARVANPEWLVYTLSLKDRFGDLGLIGAAMVRVGDPAWELDTFLMSCRALGRRVEEAFVAYLVDLAAAEGKPLRGVFIPTKKTAPIQEMLVRNQWLLDQAPNADGQLRVELTSRPVPEWLELTVT